jgi:uncharacterized damage-inducible protein DinB
LDKQELAMMRKTMWIAVVALSCTVAGQAQAGGQMGGMKMQTPAVGSPVDPAKEIDGMLNLFETEFMGVVKAMPADKYSFAPQTSMIPGSKYDGVRTFAAQVAHVIQANYSFYSRVGDMKPDIDMKAVGSMTKKEDLVAAAAASFAFAHKAIATITTANAFIAIKGADGMNTRASLASFGVAHGYDHYGQLVEYLRMNGIIPPASAGSM